MSELKQFSKGVLSDAVALHDERGDVDLTALQAYLLIATAALSKAESEVKESDDETRRTIKRARKLFQEFLPPVEKNEVAGVVGLDLGQYVHTKVFDGNSKKVEKFARLMGGAKGEPVAHHNTFAPDSKTTQKITHELEEQFNQAIHHKGKKGLGC